MKALSITESKVADPSSDCSSEHNARKLEEDVGIERDGVQAGLVAEVPASEASTRCCEAEPTESTEDLEA